MAGKWRLPVWWRLPGWVIVSIVVVAIVLGILMFSLNHRTMGGGLLGLGIGIGITAIYYRIVR